MRRWLRALIDHLEAQRGHLFPWVPVFLGIGIGSYFALRSEPATWILGASFAGGLILLFLSRWFGAVTGPLACAAALVLMGLGLAGARAHMVAAPVIDFRYYGPVEGRIIGIDRSASDAVRITLADVVLERMAPERTPRQVRISLHGDFPFDPVPGAVIMTTAHLSAPNGPVEPSGFDFRRNAWFLGIGAVGYTRVPVLYLEPPKTRLTLFNARMSLSDHVRAALPGETGAFAAAIMTGDRSGMGQETLQDLRDSNLAHLLAISGLHMGLLAGVVFSGLRLIFLMVPAIALRWPIKKIAALGALAAAAGYLALSGGNIATERAFIMVAVVLIAVVINRRALSLRGVAMAAILVLVLWPEALLGPGFQMSFAATAALVAVFAALRDLPEKWRAPRWIAPALAVFLSSFVAGAATAPIGMAHFNQVSHYGLLANLVSVPLMGAVVMPFVVLSAALMPLGLEWIAYWPMRLGLDWILGVAREVSSWEGAVGHVMAPGPAVLPLMVLGALFIMFWKGRARLIGLVPVIASALLWHQTARPLALISEDGSLVGVMTQSGRALSKSKGAGFVAQNWLENDGDGTDQQEAAARWPDPVEDRIAIYEFAEYAARLVHVQGKSAMSSFEGCGESDIVVASLSLPQALPCLVIDPRTLSSSGAMALVVENDGLRWVTTADRTGHRLWHANRAKPDSAPTSQYVLINPTSLP